MKIHAALKHKSRLAGEVKRLQAILVRENTVRSDRTRTVDCADIINKMNDATQKLIDVKASIQRANAGIATELAKMAELKGQITFLASLPVLEGEVDTYNRSDKAPVLTWNNFMSRDMVDKQVDVLQKEINALQDTIDAYNASTDIDIVVT